MRARHVLLGLLCCLPLPATAGPPVPDAVEATWLPPAPATEALAAAALPAFPEHGAAAGPEDARGPYWGASRVPLPDEVAAALAESARR